MEDMKMKMKYAGLFALMLVVMSLFGSIAVAAPRFNVDKIEIDGVEFDATYNPNAGDALQVYVERGQVLPIDVTLRGAANAYDVRVRAYIGGYEYGTIEDETEIFQIKNGVVRTAHIALNIPEDVFVGDNTFTLFLEVFDGDSSERYAYKLNVEEPRHFVTTYDVILNPPSNVKAGQPLFASVRVENLGDNVESSIKVTVSIPELGISTSEYVDELITEQDLDQERFIFSKRDSASTNDLMLIIPEDAKEGDYQVKTTVEYNRGHTKEEAVKTIHIKGVTKAPVVMGPVAVVSVDSAVQTAEMGKGAVYKVSVANLGADAKIFMVETMGTSGWATARVDPQLQTVAGEKTADFNVYVSPNEGATAGAHSFSVLVKDSEGKLVAEKALSVNVNAVAEKDTLRNVLEVAFVVLLIILVVVGLIVLVRKLGSDEPEEAVEGKTYY